MITLDDFSENTLNKFNAVVSKQIPVIEFIDLLFNLDFDQSDILDFIKVNIKGNVSFCKNRLKQLNNYN